MFLLMRVTFINSIHKPLHPGGCFLVSYMRITFFLFIASTFKGDVGNTTSLKNFIVAKIRKGIKLTIFSMSYENKQKRAVFSSLLKSA